MMHNMSWLKIRIVTALELLKKGRPNSMTVTRNTSKRVNPLVLVEDGQFSRGINLELSLLVTSSTLTK